MNSSLIVHTHQYYAKQDITRAGRNTASTVLAKAATSPVRVPELGYGLRGQFERTHLVEQVQNALHNAPGFIEDDVRAINVVVNGSVLELHGNVRTAWHAMTAEQIARRAASNCAVRSLLVTDTVLMLQLDRMLRTELQLDIDDLRINVRYGVVAIQGHMVLSEQGTRVGQLARQLAGVRVVLNLLEDACPELAM